MRDMSKSLPILAGLSRFDTSNFDLFIKRQLNFNLNPFDSSQFLLLL